MANLLDIKNLCVSVNKKQILKGLTLKIDEGETHVIMGPNGAGKSTLSNAILSNPNYKKTDGQILFLGQDITNKKTNDISRAGIFLSFQNPEEIEGLTVFNLLKQAKGDDADYFDLKDELDEIAQKLKMKKELLMRDLNVGFSGGEKKKNEILQMLALNPKLAILDETDSGLDVDATKIVSKGIELFKTNKNAVLIITHSFGMLKNLKIDHVHILIDGKIVKSGKQDLIEEIKENGYKNFLGE